MLFAIDRGLRHTLRVVTLSLLLGQSAFGFDPQELEKMMDQVKEAAKDYKGDLEEKLSKAQNGSMSTKGTFEPQELQNKMHQATQVAKKYKGDLEETLVKAQGKVQRCAGMNFNEPFDYKSFQDCKTSSRNEPKNAVDLDNNQPLIFISKSLPAETIRQLIVEAKIHKARLIIRGLVNQSFKETGAWAQEINYGVDIDPRLFKRFAITHVPAFVIPKATEKGSTWHRFKGNVTLSYAMEKAAGDQS